MSMKPEHKCPAPGCKKRIGTAYAFCLRHWRMVPAPIQGRIYAHWNACQWLEHKQAIKDAIVCIAGAGAERR